jgi:UDP-N-acetylmuramate dehydrogenase
MTANQRLKIEQNVPLAPFTTLKIGGAARFFVRAETETDVVRAVAFAEENALEIFVLGGGSNVLVADEGFDGLALQIALKGISLSDEKTGAVAVEAQAGEDWDEFVNFCVGKNLAGVECLSGIPGFVGGTPVQNVGAYGQEVSETIVKVRAFDRKSREILELSNAECRFAYRASIFNTTDKNRFIVLAVTFALNPGGAPKIAYKDLQQYFGETRPTLKDVRRAVLEIRRAKSMVIEPRDVNSRSAGSFFKNPLVDAEKYSEIVRRAKEFGIGNVPKFDVSSNVVKIPAAWLIEQSGFSKGFRFGKVGISTKHTLAIVNFENGLAKDVLALKNEIQKTVEEKFGVRLTPEPVFVGFEKI